jgi:hypothetical protein
VEFAGQARASDAVTVLESAWLQVLVARMLRQDLASALITAFVHKTVETLRGLDPALIYFWTPAPEEAMQKRFVRRGMTWATSLSSRLSRPRSPQPDTLDRSAPTRRALGSRKFDHDGESRPRTDAELGSRRAVKDMALAA